MHRSKAVCGWVLGIVALVTVAWFGWSSVATRRMKSALSAMERAGLSTSLAAFDRSEIPAHENAAPLYLAAFDLVRAIKTAGDDGSSFVDAVPNEETKAALARYAEALALARQAAAMPRCAFVPPTTLDDEFGEHAIDALDLGRALHASAITRLAANDHAGAEEDLNALLALGRAQASDPTLMAQIVYLALHSMAIETARDAVGTAPDPLETVRRLRVAEPRGAVAKGVRFDIALAAEFVATDVSFTRFLRIRESTDEAAPSMFEQMRDTLIGPLFRSSCARFLADSVERCAIYDEPYVTAIPRLEHETQVDAASLDPFRRMLAVNVAPMLIREAQTCANARLLALGACALDYKRAHGAWPNALADFAADVSIVDPASDRPFELRRDGDALVLASPSDPKVIWRL